MAQSWSEVRKQAALAPGRVTEARKELDRREHAYRLNEVRNQMDLSQAKVAEAMHVAQPRVSELENGDISRVLVSTLADYIQALGGKLELTAVFADRRLPL
jgi:predicted XRE-type DNA-binding protein